VPVFCRELNLLLTDQILFSRILLFFAIDFLLAETPSDMIPFSFPRRVVFFSFFLLVWDLDLFEGVRISEFFPRPPPRSSITLFSPSRPSPQTFTFVGPLPHFISKTSVYAFLSCTVFFFSSPAVIFSGFPF